MLYLFIKHLFHLFVVIFRHFLSEAKAGLVLNQIGTDITGHNKNDIFEVDVSAEAVGQPALFHNLQQHIVNVGMCLLDFIQKQYGIGPSPDSFGQLSSFLLADIARRRAYESADVVLFHKFAHIQLDEGVFVS